MQAGEIVTPPIYDKQQSAIAEHFANIRTGGQTPSRAFVMYQRGVGQHPQLADPIDLEGDVGILKVGVIAETLTKANTDQSVSPERHVGTRNDIHLRRRARVT